MAIGFRINFETFDLENRDVVLSKAAILEDMLTAPNNCLDFSIIYEKQIEIMSKLLDQIIAAKVSLLNEDLKLCPKCKGEMIKIGKNRSTFHDVLTDHTVAIQRYRCKQCRYEPPSTIRDILGVVQSGQLSKIQAELGAEHTFRETENIFKKFCGKNRGIDNRTRVKETVAKIGRILEKETEEAKKIMSIPEAKELVLNVDGGHIKTTEDQQSIEALTSVVYRPESLELNAKGTRNILMDKSCAASVKDDNQKEIISQTILAAIKQGLTPNTHITALCDGATNCWNVVDALKPLSKSVTYILDWFHVSMKMKNIALPKEIKPKFLRVKWHLWRGNVPLALKRLNELVDSISEPKAKEKIEKFINYIKSNTDKIINYRKRKNNKKVFTSHLAEATVESLINVRCKGKQHMRWSREGLNPLLQIRARIHTNEWDDQWREAVLQMAI